MSRSVLMVGVLMLVVSAACRAADVPNNERLSEIFETDQASRRQQPIDWQAMVKQDREHRAEVLGMIRAGTVRTAQDYFNAALVFQHGETLEDYRLTFALAKLSATLDPEFGGARGLMAASWDRALMSRKVPQWCGTQFHRKSQDAPTELYTIDESVVSDEERAALNVPSLQEAKERARQFNTPEGQ